MEKGTPIVVTTAHRGVFFGKFVSREDREITISEARVCVYWNRETRGFVGLAVTGPLDGCRVSPAAPKLTLTDVTAILECTPESAEKWGQSPWQ